jgi:hypothetical protein
MTRPAHSYNPTGCAQAGRAGQRNNRVPRPITHQIVSDSELGEGLAISVEKP